MKHLLITTTIIIFIFVGLTFSGSIPKKGLTCLNFLKLTVAMDLPGGPLMATL